MNGEISTLWYNAMMNEEMKYISKNQVWDLIESPKGSKVVGCKWVYKTKKDVCCNIKWYKVRLVANDYTKKKGMYYHETFDLKFLRKKYLK